MSTLVHDQESSLQSMPESESKTGTVAQVPLADGTGPRLGFLGAGWIGRNRLEAVHRSGLARVAAVSDTVISQATQALEGKPNAVLVDSFDRLLAMDLDGIVIATPSALHAAQAEMALKQGLPVFCQKPLGRNGAETAGVIATAREANLLLGVDLSYRHLSGSQKVRDLIRCGALGEIYAAELVFHNAYGPDKPWFYDPKLSGGGCVIDLGIHLVDLAFWMLNFPKVADVTSRLYSQGKPVCIGDGPRVSEDYAEVRIDTETGASIRLTCSWKLHAGQDAVIGLNFYGTQGGVAVHNVNGSFYDFSAYRFTGTGREILFSQEEDWGGRAIIEWTRQLGISASFNPEIESLNRVASTLDLIYQ